VPSPADFIAAAFGAVPLAVLPPISAIPAPPVGEPIWIA
jgi:hypothetical protein